MQTTLNRALADHARAEAERDALQATAGTQATELAQAREARESLIADLTKLAAQFDGNAAAVKQAQDTLAELAKTAQPSKPVELGAALTELRNLRAVHALKPAAAPAGAKP